MTDHTGSDGRPTDPRWDPPPAEAVVPEGAAPGDAPPRALVRSPLSDGEWQRLHPLTPLLRGGLFLLVIIGIIVANLRERLIELFLPAVTDLPPGVIPPDPVDFILANNLILIAAGGALAVLIVLLVIFRLSWRFHTFRISDDDVEVRSGVLFRTHRRAPLDRVQGVNLTRPMVARLLGLAKLEVVGAGLDSNVKLEYLSAKAAETVRGDILRLASGRRLAERGVSSPAGSAVQQAADAVAAGIQGIVDGEDFSDAEPESIVRIPFGRLVASRLLSGSTLMLVALIIAIIVGASLSTLWFLFTIVPAFLAFGAYYVRSIARGLRYSIAPSPDGVRLTFGLFTTISEVVPPGRVHAIEVHQPLLWRPFGWWSISVNRLTGRGSTDSTTDPFAAVLPIGTRDDVERVLRILAPALPPEEWSLVFRDGILGPIDDDPYVVTPRRVRLLRPLSWRRNGAVVTPDALFLRRGWVRRTLVIVPLARLQSVGLRQGPLGRATRTATLAAHVIAGTVRTSVGALDRDAALTLFDDTARATVAAAAEDRSHRWAG
ncbi:PH domain-containing protein [Microbacterium sp. RURRCA19A]|uniref:PH domain-containing protein n=1 Tax=Microbacterium sp. RURRCA19A TaxID=1907391 RepID=UPI000955372A|nr:PH domain-containing protein [Microbacterium sp. RURRCA19A]SIR89430.1 putative membrane protein [Microbacterium sp. RURRCA19A]